MRSALIAAVAFLFAAAGPALAQSRQCLHDEDETSANRSRREKAVELAYAINDAQHSARGLHRLTEGGYVPLEQLSKLPKTPDGFRVQLQTDGKGYSFSIKDMMDPCLFGVFSDQSGDVYEATPGQRKARLKLLSE